MKDTRIVLALLGAALSILFLAPLLVSAQTNVGSAADATCIAYCTIQAQIAQQKHNPALNCPPVGTAIQVCTASPPGGTVTGQCHLDGCKSASASGLNGGNAQSSLGQLGQLLSSVLGKLLQPSPPSASSPTTASPTGCLSAYYYTSNTSLIGVDPCALYQPSSATQITTGTTGTTGITGTGSSSAQALLDALTGSTGSNTTGSNTVGTAGGSLTATPQSGAAPLSVSLTTTSIAMGTYTVDFGDGSNVATPTSSGCTSNSPSTCQYQITHTYSSAGTYNATLSDSEGLLVATVSISVTNPGGTTTTSNSNNPGVSQILGSVSNFLAGTTSAQGTTQTYSSFPGVFGNILLDQNGATIFASTINSANNSETSGFYGSDTLSGSSSFAGQLCQNRPWASNFLADVIPPTFFDSLCQWGGYQVGQPAQPQVTLVQTQTQTQTSGTSTAKPVATTTAATSTPVVAAQAQIWSVPSAVPLGARTSIFWNTQNAASCTETSPDGNFSQNSLSGAASTVPLTGPTTFTISCLDEGGNPVTDFVTVQISS